MSPFRRLWNVVRGTRLNDELDAELATHLALIEEEGRASGLSPEEARRQARSRFGNPVSYREQALDGVMARWSENLWKDACLAVRYLRKTPAFTLAAVLSLALGLGASSAIFTLIDAVLVRPLAVREPDGLLLLGRARSSGVGTGAVGSFSVYSHDLYKHLEASHVFAGLCASQSASSSRVSVRRAAGTAEPAEAKLVSGNYFDVLGVQPALGRALTPFDDSAGAPPVAVVSFRYWQDALGSDPSAIGSSLDLNGIPVSIVGVAPAEFFGDTLQPEPPSFWIPIAADRRLDPERSVVDAPDQHWLYLFGRLSPGISSAQAEARLTASLRTWLMAREGSTISEERQRGIARSYVELTPGGSGITRMSRAYSTTLRLLLGCRWRFCSSPAPTSPIFSWQGLMHAARRALCGWHSAQVACDCSRTCSARV
jgi:MacB-like periplasmic core domain